MPGLTRELIALRVARELQPGSVVNLGIGLPTLVAGFVDPADGILFQAENGILGYAGVTSGDYDPDLINAGGQPVDLVAGASFFDTAMSFAMIRGGHVDLTVLGAMQVDEKGNIANWMIPGKMVKGMGGAMDLVAGSRRVIVAMIHATKDGKPKLLTECSLPLTGVGVVDRIVTELAVIDVTDRGLEIRELREGVNLEDVQKVTEPTLIAEGEIGRF